MGTRATERMHRQGEGRAVSDAALRQALDLVREGIALLSRDGTILYANRRLTRMADVLQEDLAGRRFLELFDSAAREQLGARLDQCVSGCPTEGTVRLASRHDQRPYNLALCRPPAAEQATAVYAVLWPAPAPSAIEGLAGELQRVSRLVLTAQENERERIAADLHDGLGQSLSAVRFGLQSIGVALGNGAISDARGTLHCLDGVVKNALEEVRRLAMNLRPSTLDDLGVLATISWFLREFQALYRTIAVIPEVRVTEADIPAEAKVALFRVVQEAMNNVAKHSQATTVRLRLERRGDRLHLAIEDDGVGFDAAAVASRTGLDKRHGHTCARERVQSTGGAFGIESAPGRGTKIKVSWPQPMAAAASRIAGVRQERDHGYMAHIDRGGPHPSADGVAGPPEAGP